MFIQGKFRMLVLIVADVIGLRSLVLDVSVDCDDATDVTLLIGVTLIKCQERLCISK